MMKLISIVVPVYNEEDNIRHFYEAICEVMQELPYEWELVFVDDGSGDRSWEILQEMEQSDSRVQPIQLSRNKGHQLALTCGMDYAEGDAVITMDGDMQHPPELLPVLIHEWEQGFEIVQTVRKTTEGVSWAKNFSSNGFYWLLNHISDTHIIEGGSDFRLMDAKVVRAFRHYREHVRFIRGMISEMGCISVLIFLHVLYVTYIGGNAERGWPTIIGCIVFFGGVQLMTLGIIGVYIGRIFEEVKRRPLYLVEREKPTTRKRMGEDN